MKKLAIEISKSLGSYVEFALDSKDEAGIERCRMWAYKLQELLEDALKDQAAQTGLSRLLFIKPEHYHSNPEVVGAKMLQYSKVTSELQEVYEEMSSKNVENIVIEGWDVITAMLTLMQMYASPKEISDGLKAHHRKMTERSVPLNGFIEMDVLFKASAFKK